MFFSLNKGKSTDPTKRYKRGQKPPCLLFRPTFSNRSIMKWSLDTRCEHFENTSDAPPCILYEFNKSRLTWVTTNYDPTNEAVKIGVLRDF